MGELKMDLQLFAGEVKQTVHSGATILIKVNGITIGRAQALDGRRSYGTEGVYEIGSIMPQEFVNNRYEGSLSLERFFVRKNDLVKAGVASLGEEVLKKDMLTFEVIDKYTEETVRCYYGCSISEYSESFRVGAIAGENATMLYLSVE
jgi:hypothetical protein